MNLRKNLHRYINLYNYVEAYRSNTLPNGYTKLDYIESDGTQYIDTGYKPNNNTSIDIKFSTSSKAHFVFGSRKSTSGSDQQRFCLYVDYSDFNPQYGNRNYPAVSSFDVSTVYQVQMNKNGFIVDGITVQDFTSENFTSENNLILFGNNTNGTIVTAENRIYYSKIYEDSTLVCNLIPAKRNSDNVVGMFDTISQAFFTNAGTGEFIAGPESSGNSFNDSLVLQDAIKDSLKSLKAYGKTELKPDTLLDTVVANGGTEILSHDYIDSIIAKGKTEQRKLPVGYQELEYIRGTGAQYINTGIKANSAYTYKLKVSRKSPYNKNIFGIKEASGYSDAACLIIGWTGTEYIGAYSHTGTGSGANPQVVQWIQDQPFLLEFNPTGEVFKIDGVNKWTEIKGSNNTNLTNASFTSNLNIYLFGTNTAGSFVGNGDSSWYSYQAYDNNNRLLQNLVPARNASGVVGMYDTVSCTFFTNSGTGSFIAGPLVNLPEEYERIEYIESSGTQYIDTGVLFDKATNYGKIKTTLAIPNTSNTGYIGADGNINIGWSNGQIFTGGAAGSGYAVTSNIPYDVVAEITSVGANRTLTINDTTIIGTPSPYSTNVVIFGVGSQSGTPINLVAVKIYNFSVYRNDVLKFNGIPAKRNSDSVLGMYDLVSGQFFTNQGTGTFTAGPSLNVPSDYTVLDYIESTGTQWIDTGIKDIVNSEFEITAQQTTISGNFPTIVGAVDGDTASPVTDYKVIVGLSTANNNYYTQTGGTNGYHVSNIPNDTNKHKFNVKVGTNQTILTIDDTNVYPGSYAVTTTQKYSLFICARNKSTVSNFTQQKVFSFTARKNGTLISNLVPVIRNSDGVIGMYDTVSGTLLTNQGTGTFKAGYKADILPDNPVDIYCNNGVLKVNLNLYWAEYHGYELSQVDGITTKENGSVNVSGMVDCRTIKSFKITTISPQGAFRVFKYRADNTFINAAATASIGDTITFEDEVGFFRIQYNYTNIGVNTENVLIYNSVCDLNEIYTEGTTETIYKYSKNLFNEKWNKDTGTSTQSSAWGQVVTISGWSTSELVPVVAGEKYTTSYSTNIDRQYVFYYNADGTMQQSYNDTTNPTLTVTIPTNCTHVRLQCHKSGTALDSIQTQLEVGSNATTYEPYTHDAEIATCEDLFGLYSYQDTQNILNGSISRNIKVLVLDGTENWTAGAAGKYYLNITSAYVKAQYTPLCSHFQMYTEPGGTGDMAVPNMLALYVGSVDAYQLYAYPNSTIGATVNTWKAWLAQQYAAGTPVMIIYPLATATSETVSKQINNKETGDTIEVIAGSLEDLEVTNTSSTHTVPLPDYPLDINCNNGIVKLGKDIYNATLTQGIYQQDGTISSTTTTWIATPEKMPVKEGVKYIVKAEPKIGGKTLVTDVILFNNSTYVGYLPVSSLPCEFVPDNTYNKVALQFAYDPRANINPSGVWNVQLIENDIYVDGTVETLWAHGKNLFNENDVILGYFYEDNGTYTSNANTFTSGKIPMNAGTTVTFSRGLSVNNVYLRIHAFNSNNEWIGLVAKSASTSGMSATGTTPANTSYIRVCGAKKINDTEIDHECQVELGSTATAYEPYIEYNTATCEDLLKVSTYTDIHDVISGTITRNVGVKVLDGTENWFDVTGYTDIYGLAVADGVLPSNTACVCSHYLGTTASNATMQNNTIKAVHATVLAPNKVSVYIKDTTVGSLNNFKAWLAQQYAAGTPVIVIYPLATVTTEMVDKQRMRKGIVSITEASMTGLTVDTTESVHIMPSPDFPLDLYCNNGVIKGVSNGVITEGNPEILNIKGKNLFDITKDTTSKYIDVNGNISVEPYSSYSELLEVKPGEVYTYSGMCNQGSTASANNKRIHGYINGVWNQQISVTTVDKFTPFYTTFTIPAGINGIRISHWTDDTYTQLEKGTRPTQYENYMSINCSVEDLLSVGNYQDIEDLKAGITNRKVGIKVLDGTETWSVSTTNVVQANVLTNNAHSETCISSHFTYTTSSTLANMPDNSFRNGSSVYTTRLYVKSSTLATDTTTWKKYLADQYALGTPVIVIYPLATETTESTITQNVDIVSGTNTIERNSEYLNDLGVDAEFKKLR